MSSIFPSASSYFHQQSDELSPNDDKDTERCVDYLDNWGFTTREQELLSLNKELFTMPLPSFLAAPIDKYVGLIQIFYSYDYLSPCFAKLAPILKMRFFSKKSEPMSSLCVLSLVGENGQTTSEQKSTGENFSSELKHEIGRSTLQYTLRIKLKRMVQQITLFRNLYCPGNPDRLIEDGQLPELTFSLQNDAIHKIEINMSGAFNSEHRPIAVFNTVITYTKQVDTTKRQFGVCEARELT